MKQTCAALLALCVLLLAGCAQKNTKPAEPAQTPSAPAAAAPEPAPAPPEETETVYTADGIEVPVPKEYDALLTVTTDLEPWDEHSKPLISFAERESVEAGQRQHPGEDWGDGELCTLMRLDRVGFEGWVSGDDTGTRLFARDGDDAYYLMAHPTDVRLARDTQEAFSSEETTKQWTMLNDWASALRQEITARNGLTAYDASDLLDADYTYPGEHVEMACHFPGEAMDAAVLSLSQPVKQGEGGIWCVERVRFVYSAYDWEDVHLVFPAALGIDETAESYYARMQAECDAGGHAELLTPRGAALDYARRVTWIFGEDVSASDFEAFNAVG